MPLNNLDPQLSLFAPDGATLLASDLNSATDSKNTKLTFTAPSAGTYTIGGAATSRVVNMPWLSFRELPWKS